MRTFCLLTGLTAGLALCGVLMAAPIVADGMPEVLYSQGPGSSWPVWVAANRAVNGEGRFDSELIHPAIRAYYDQTVAESPAAKGEGCVEMVQSGSWDLPADRATIAEAVESAEMVFLGRVTGVAYGFGFREPGQLIQIAPEQVFQGDVRLTKYYVFVPVGSFRAGSIEICKKESVTFRNHEAPYKVGDELLVMPRKSRLRSPDDPFISLRDGQSLALVREDDPPANTPLHARAKEYWAHIPNRTTLVTAISQAVSALTPTEGRREAKSSEPHPVRLEMAKPLPHRWIWQRADQVFDANGEFLDGALAPWAREFLREQLGDHQLYDDSGCLVTGGLVDDQHERPDRVSISGAAKGSTAVILGEVERSAFGFFKDQPGQLVRFRPTRTFKGGPLTLDSYYFFIPVGEFEAGPYKFCKSDSRYPSPPAPGEEVLVMVPDQYEWSPDDPFIRLETAHSLVIISTSDHIRRTSQYAEYPEAKKEGRVRDRAALLDLALSATKAEER